jgi:hypothetical protein
MAFGDLTTLCDVRTWLQTGQQPYPSTDDALLARLISAASGFIAAWLNRPIVQADWQELRDGVGNDTFVFSVQPVSAVLLVVVNNLTIPAVPAIQPAPPGLIAPAISTFPWGYAGYVFTPTALTIRGYPIPRMKACVQLQYTAGFPTVPLDVAQACIELVCRKYRERTRIAERSKGLAGETTTYETVSFTLRDMASDIQVLLQQYRQVAPVFGAAPVMAPTQFDPATLVAAA